MCTPCWVLCDSATACSIHTAYKLLILLLIMQLYMIMIFCHSYCAFSTCSVHKTRFSYVGDGVCCVEQSHLLPPALSYRPVAGITAHFHAPEASGKGGNITFFWSGHREVQENSAHEYAIYMKRRCLSLRYMSPLKSGWLGSEHWIDLSHFMRHSDHNPAAVTMAMRCQLCCHQCHWQREKL